MTSDKKQEHYNYWFKSWLEVEKAYVYIWIARIRIIQNVYAAHSIKNLKNGLTTTHW